MSENEKPQAPERQDDGNDEDRARMTFQDEDDASKRADDDTQGHKYGPPIRGGF